MRPPPWCIGFKMPANRHPGRRHIGACNERVGGPNTVRYSRASDARSGRVQVNIGGRQPLSRSPLVSDADLRALALLVPRGMGEPARTPVDGLTLP
jgi:hypothetical protein